MGLSESKIVLERLKSACVEADYRGCDDIQDLISDDEVCDYYYHQSLR